MKFENGCCLPAGSKKEGIQNKEPSFELNIDRDFLPEIEEEEDEIAFRSGSLALFINKKEWAIISINFTRKYRLTEQQNIYFL